MEIDILGTTLTLESDEGPEHLSCVIRHVKQMLGEIQQTHRTKDPQKLAILVSCLLSSEYWKLRNKYITLQKQVKVQNEHNKQIEQYAEHMLDNLQSNLPPQN